MTQPTKTVTVAVAGLYGSCACDPGDTVELPADRADELLKLRHVVAEGEAIPEPAETVETVETTETVETVETTETTETETETDHGAPVELSECGIAGKSLALLNDAGLTTDADVLNAGDLTEINGIGEATAASILAQIEAYHNA